MARAIMLLLHQPNLANDTPKPEWLKTTELPGADLLHALIEKVIERPHLTTAGLLELWRDSESSTTLLKLAQKQILAPEKGFKKEFLGALQRIKQTHMEQRAEFLLQKNPSELTHEERKELTEALDATKKHEI